MTAPLPVILSLPVQGSTGSPSTFQVSNPNSANGKPFQCRVRVCNQGTFANSTNATIAALAGCTAVETHTSNKDITFQSSPAAAATGTLTISGVVIDTELVTINGDVFEFDTHAASTITAGHIRVNIGASATKAQGTLTLAVQPAAGETFTMGNRTYVYVASGTAENPGEISIGADLPAAKLTTVAAINGTDGFNTPNSLVSASAFSTNVCTVTALAGGTAGNSIVMTEALAGSGNVMNGSGVLGATTAGTDCTAANAGIALAAAINTRNNGVSASNTTGTITITALTKGVVGNSIATTEGMANAAFGAATLTGGTDNAPNRIQVQVTDASAETVTLRIGPPLLSPPVNLDFTATRDLAHA